jgi:hypothetical protein
MAEIGFGDKPLVLIRGYHWRSHENRRPILMQAWFVEFIDTLVAYVKKTYKQSFPKMESQGAQDRLKYLLGWKSLFSSFSIEIQDNAKKLLHKVRITRNKGIHRKIQNLEWPKEMLQEMIHFCQLLGIAELNYFKKQCKKELDRMNSHVFERYY